MRSTVVLITALLMLGCEQADVSNTSDTNEAIPVSERMAAPPQPGFKRADTPRKFDFPADHGAHPEYATEWWYFTGNLATGAGRPFGYQLTLFRVGLAAGTPADDSPLRSTQMYMGHLAITDIQTEQHYSAERFSRAANGLAGAEAIPLNVWLGSWRISSDTRKEPFPLTLRAENEDFGINLTLQRGNKPRVLQGEDGWSRKSAEPGNASYYYSYTRLPSHGRLRIGNAWHQVNGSSWFDREWSSSALGPDQAGWDWLSLQLQDGRDLMFYRMRDKQGRAQIYSKGVLVDQNGQTLKLNLDNTHLEPIDYWISETSGVRYPIGWRLEVIEQDIALRIDATISDQEMDHSVRYWEGAVTVSGSHRGVGYLEMSGYTRQPR